VAALQLPFAIGFISIIGALLVMPTSLLVAPLGVKVARSPSGSLKSRSDVTC
jgi:hypothetical protein